MTSSSLCVGLYPPIATSYYILPLRLCVAANTGDTRSKFFIALKTIVTHNKKQKNLKAIWRHLGRAHIESQVTQCSIVFRNLLERILRGRAELYCVCVHAVFSTQLTVLVPHAFGIFSIKVTPA